MRHGDKRHRLEVDRAGVQREHDGVAVAQLDAVVASIGGVAGERQHLDHVRGEVLLDQILFDARVRGVHGE